MLRSTNYNSPVDIFALGCIIAELYNFYPLFPGANETDQLNKMVKILGTPDKSEWPEGYKLSQSLSKRDFMFRLSFSRWERCEFGIDYSRCISISNRFDRKYA